ncbi:general secretion pathway protein GspK [Thalassobius vesicularis]|uniref:Type II secretion system protein K n=1 Tax=Thalassobius vesicularis TaxID=1294297 RepID=A0A4S3MGC2_9RHOB|nr:type II secretion system minor pseudopilin GspK [Thalassobius vesicularis]THD76794.1 general secretion pathway protein GspK [Thalassobius vesicularis]
MRQRGFVLVNALVLVAVLAAIAVLLLSRSDAGRTRLAASLGASQLELNLSAAEALAVTLLNREGDGRPDHLGRGWARGLEDADLDPGRVSLVIEDLQGRFNVNWLSSGQNVAASEAFARLLAGLGVSQNDQARIRSFVQPGGPSDKSAFLALDPPQDPVGGAVMMIDQIMDLPLSDRTRARLGQLLTALPGESVLNPNTAAKPVLAAFLPELTAAQIDALIAQRRKEPFRSVGDFLAFVGLATPDDGTPAPPQQLGADMLGVTSDWFALTVNAQLEERTATRRALLNRQGNPAQTRVVWRITTRP